MRGVLVAFDLETTGLDIENDSIIEIGAVRIQDGKILDEYQQLVNPGFEIPAETTHITGIRQADMENAPALASVLPAFLAYVGDAPVIAHNAAFDVTFMRRFNGLQHNLPIDTFEMASILVPQGSLYNLSSLSEYFGIKLENAHRALADARATALLYWELWQLALALPTKLLTEINRAAQGLMWDLSPLFSEALTAKQSTAADDDDTPLFSFAINDTTLPPPLTPNPEPTPLDADSLAATLHSEAERSEGQQAVARAVSAAFNNRQHLMVEVGTGVERSQAYLLTAMHWALQNNTPVVIATDGRNQRDHLLKHDIPQAAEKLGQPIRAFGVYGRRDYLCPRRLQAMQRRTPTTLDELRTYAKILIWLQGNPTGVRNEISLRAGEHYVWNRLSAEDEHCTTQRCEALRQGHCPFYRARKQAEAAHLLVAQQNMLVLDAREGDVVMPAYQHAIIDEAHQLEDAASSIIGLRMGQIGLIRRIEEIGGPSSGILGELLASGQASLPEKKYLRLSGFIEDIAEGLRALHQQVQQFFGTGFKFYYEINKQETHSGLRITDKHRDLAEFKAWLTAWLRAREFFDVIVETLSNLTNALEKLRKHDLPYFDDLVISLNAAVDYLLLMRGHLQEFIAEPSNNGIYWINSGSDQERITLQKAPLNVGSTLDKLFWGQKASVVLTSTTLRTDSSFTFMQGRLGAEQIPTTTIGSPYNYKQSALLYIPDDMPLPGRPGYQRAVERAIIDLAATLNGRVLALFTSFGQLRETATSIAPRLALGNIAVYDQATGGNRETVLENFIAAEKAVLLGTRSFWHEVDIPGDGLSALVIVRLPFGVPNDPLFSGRSEVYNDPFPEYAVPEAILRFRQGFGRLIRSQTDKGIVTVLDNRIIAKSYGLSFIESLPDCTLKYGPVEGLAKAAKAWLKPNPA